MIDLEHIRHHRLESDPYQWAAIKDLFNSDDAARLAATYPCDHFKLVAAYGGEKDYGYEARSLIGMGADVITHPADLSDAWQALALDLLSPEYRAAMTTLTGCDLCDLTRAPMEANVFHYGPGGSLGAHRDLPEEACDSRAVLQPFVEQGGWRLSEHPAIRRSGGPGRRNRAHRRTFIRDRPIGKLLARRFARRQRLGPF